MRSLVFWTPSLAWQSCTSPGDSWSAVSWITEAYHRGTSTNFFWVNQARSSPPYLPRGAVQPTQYIYGATTAGSRGQPGPPAARRGPDVRQADRRGHRRRGRPVHGPGPLRPGGGPALAEGGRRHGPVPLRLRPGLEPPLPGERGQRPVLRAVPRQR